MKNWQKVKQDKGEISCLLSDLHPALKRMLRVQCKEFVFYLEEKAIPPRMPQANLRPVFWPAWLADLGVSVSLAS